MGETVVTVYVMYMFICLLLGSRLGRSLDTYDEIVCMNHNTVSSCTVQNSQPGYRSRSIKIVYTYVESI